MDDATIYKKLKDTLKKPEDDKLRSIEFKTCHKYIAIVQADGDNLGKTIRSLPRNSDFETLSRELFLFAKQAGECIETHGGTPVYIGGDDLLFFAPVEYRNKSVFDLCHCLGELFSKKMKKLPVSAAPTLSFGVSISYYKFPLFEALAEAEQQLRSAKSGFNKRKNTLAFRFLKHSGRYFGGLLPIATSVHEEFINLINAKSETDLLSSVIHNLLRHQPLIEAVAQDHQRLKNIFANFYNEDIHARYSDFFEKLIALIHTTFTWSQYPHQDRIAFIHSVLRLKKSLKERRTEND